MPSLNRITFARLPNASVCCVRQCVSVRVCVFVLVASHKVNTNLHTGIDTHAHSRHDSSRRRRHRHTCTVAVNCGSFAYVKTEDSANYHLLNRTHWLRYVRCDHFARMHTQVACAWLNTQHTFALGSECNCAVDVEHAASMCVCSCGVVVSFLT